jgi:competence protein ComEA
MVDREEDSSSGVQEKSMRSGISAASLMTIAALATGICQAAMSTLPNPGQGQKTSKPASANQAKPGSKIKRVDINQSGKAELMTLPGIGAAEADRIIAARPYGSKAWLATRNVIPEGLYFGIKDKIVAGPAGQAALQKK